MFLEVSIGEVTGDKAWAMRPCAQMWGVLFDTVKSLNIPSLGILGFAWLIVVPQKPIISHLLSSYSPYKYMKSAWKYRRKVYVPSFSLWNSSSPCAALEETLTLVVAYLCAAICLNLGRSLPEVPWWSLMDYHDPEDTLACILLHHNWRV